MKTDQQFIDLLRLLANSLEYPDPDRVPLSEIATLGDRAVPLLIAALADPNPSVRATAAMVMADWRRG